MILNHKLFFLSSSVSKDFWQQSHIPKNILGNAFFHPPTIFNQINDANNGDKYAGSLLTK